MSPSLQGRGRRRLFWIVGLLLVLFVGLPLALSPLAKSAINRRLATLPGYEAQVGGVRIAVWKLAIEIEDFVLRERNQVAEGPLVKVARGKMTLLPGALLRGKVRGHGFISDTELLVFHQDPETSAGEGKDEKETPRDGEVSRAGQWQRELQERFDIEISHFEITRAKIRFVDRSRPANPELTLVDFRLLAKNLKTRAQPGEVWPAQIEISARFPGGGTLRGDADFAPLETPPRFRTAVEVKDLSLPPLREFLLSYALVDVRQGTFEVFIEAEAEGGGYSGYVKPFFRDLEFSAVADPEKGVLRNAATKVASAVTKLLKNEEQKVATKAPFQGNFDQNDVDIMTTIQYLLRNAFIQSLREGFEGQNPTN